MKKIVTRILALISIVTIAFIGLEKKKEVSQPAAMPTSAPVPAKPA